MPYHATCENPECTELNIEKDVPQAIADNVAQYPPLYCGGCQAELDVVADP